MNDVKKKLDDIESMIENAVWDAAADDDIESELQHYREAESLLMSLTNLNGTEEKERKRILAYCLMRIDESLNNLGQDEGTLERANESLRIAIESEDSVQIARSRLFLGIRLLNSGHVGEAESHFSDIIKGGLESENGDMKQVVGWTLLVRANILKGKSLYDQALHVAKDAVAILSSIDNYAGLARTYSFLSSLYDAQGEQGQARKCKDMSEEFDRKSRAERK